MVGRFSDKSSDAMDRAFERVVKPKKVGQDEPKARRR
jgi:hypothetical protein